MSRDTLKSASPPLPHEKRANAGFAVKADETHRLFDCDAQNMTDLLLETSETRFTRQQPAELDQDLAGALRALIDTAAGQSDESESHPKIVCSAEPQLEGIREPGAGPEMQPHGDAKPNVNSCEQPVPAAGVDTRSNGHFYVSAREPSRAHWMAREMSRSVARKDVTAAVVAQQTGTPAASRAHWMGRAMSNTADHVDRTRTSLEQWVSGSPASGCMPLHSVPVNDDLPAAATGQTTALQPYAVYPTEAVPEYSDRRVSGEAYLALSTPVSAPLPAQASGQIADSTAELLRPLLRQWLDNNMGAMIQRALSAEAAAKPPH